MAIISALMRGEGLRTRFSLATDLGQLDPKCTPDPAERTNQIHSLRSLLLRTQIQRINVGPGPASQGG